MKLSVKATACRGTRLNHGFALLLILVAVTLISLLALGMLALSERDRLSAHGISNSERTELIAQAALEHATALLDHNIPQPLPPGVSSIPAVITPDYPTQATPAGYVAPTNWVINPGLLTLIGPGNTSASVKYVPLYTQPDPTDLHLTQVDLNAPLVTTVTSNPPTYPIRGYSTTTGTPPSCLVDWVNVLKDPTQKASPTNPIVGRYAFWIDDESAKVNINMAYGKLGLNGAQLAVNLSANNPLSQISPGSNGAGDSSEEWYYGLTGTSPYYYDGVNANPLRIGTGTFAIEIPTIDAASNTTVETSYPLWHPASIDLDFLLSSAGDGTLADLNALASSVHNVYGTWKDQTTTNGYYHWRPLQTPEQIKSFIISANPDTTYENLKFDITTTARSPEFNVFGKIEIIYGKPCAVVGFGHVFSNELRC